MNIKKVLNIFLILVLCFIWCMIFFKFFNKNVQNENHNINSNLPKNNFTNIKTFKISSLDKNPFLIKNNFTKEKYKIEKNTSILKVSTIKSEKSVNSQTNKKEELSIFQNNIEIVYFGEIRIQEEILYLIKIDNKLYRLKKFQKQDNILLKEINKDFVELNIKGTDYKISIKK